MATDRRLFLEVSTAAQYVAEIVTRQLHAVGIPVHLFGLLTHVRAQAPVAPSALSATSGIPPTTLRDNIERLVSRGLATRIPNPDDRRSYLVELTPRGEVLMRAADPALLEAYVALESELERPLRDYEATLEELIAALRRVLKVSPRAPSVRTAPAPQQSARPED